MEEQKEGIQNKSSDADMTKKPDFFNRIKMIISLGLGITAIVINIIASLIHLFSDHNTPDTPPLFNNMIISVAMIIFSSLLASVLISLYRHIQNTSKNK